jgi:two-component sensor histidine kinase
LKKLVELQEADGLPVTPRAMGTVQLVVSDLVTNACKYASAGAC